MSCLLQAVLGLEQLGEDGVVERLRAQQADVEQERLADLADLAVPHHRRRPTSGSSCRPGPASSSPRSSASSMASGVGASTCSGCRRWRGSRPCCVATPGLGLPRGAVALEVRRERARRCSRSPCSQMSIADTKPPSWPIWWTMSSLARVSRMSLRRCRTSRRARGSRPKRCSSASGSQARKRGQARVQVVQPFSPWMQLSGPSSSSRWNGL